MIEGMTGGTTGERGGGVMMMMVREGGGGRDQPALKNQILEMRKEMEEKGGEKNEIKMGD